MKTLLLLCLIVFQICAQEITVLKPNQTFSSKDSSIVMTIPRFNKIDSIISVYKRQVSDYQKDSILCYKETCLSDSLQKKLILVKQENVLVMAKDTLRMAIDSMLIENTKTYQSVIKDLQNTVAKDKGSSDGFFNNTFWFGTGAIVGVAVMYLSAEIVKNIK
jgi:hypothetical protein